MTDVAPEPVAPVRVALLQLDVSDTEAVPDRVARVLELAEEVAGSADLLLLPELWHVGAFDVEQARRCAEPLDGPLVTALADVARRTGTWIHGGSLAELTEDGRFYNTSVVLSADGSLEATYRKIHLFGFDGGETVLMSAGEDLVLVDTPLGRTGLATCYDLRFPEMFRALTAQGAEAFLIPSGWPERRIGHWTLLNRARAVEDQAFVVACNQTGTHAGVPLGGRSVVVDPQGEVLVEGDEKEDVLLAEIDTGRVRAWRDAFPVLPDRRL